MRFDINQTLLRHVATGGGAAYKLRQDTNNLLPDLVGQFLGARSDITRLVRADEVAKAILSVHDFRDIMVVRNIVAQQELRRLIQYGKQQDHTAHTVYLYLLGVWFFDHVSDVRDAIFNKCQAGSTEETCRWFLNQWMYASLLHDIGYAFFDLSSQTSVDRREIDNVYSWVTIEKLFGPQPASGRELTVAEMANLRSVHDSWMEEYPLQGLALEASTSPMQVLDRLAQAPWLKDLEFKGVGSDLFDVLSMQNGELRKYAGDVARNGYQTGQTGYVDHAVASGLLLFQYVSYWYWLLKRLRRDDEETFAKVSGGHDYALSKIQSLADACIAVAYHNVVPSVAGAGVILNRITLKQHPILYLAIVCDELQVWDRYPAGHEALQQFTETAKGGIEGSDLELMCEGTGPMKASIRVWHPQHEKIVNKRRDTLRQKLSGYETIVTVISGAAEKRQLTSSLE
jgi:hypothetical protein